MPSSPLLSYDARQIGHVLHAAAASEALLLGGLLGGRLAAAWLVGRLEC